ncbi:hypothetical protein C3B44_10515 [Corynebacterium yudongzhengii]|uniref:FAD-binding FR-type domain-containing protein n=1 Tax=Corynebacterium yudongzhengii TaxID=2080740 RepID=A0A2U1T4N8_9CORY|nr:FAD-binding oxidoreductase [Corynebacterium yudongzhengii]AWB82710.1 hypothetical protein C3B44_10515 [Corynebacterium yudongzhengii]PWC00953.1 hypothetical protein DF222_10035 [Corynebacterium yudongzhengii]
MSSTTLETVGKLLRRRSEEFRDLVHEQLFVAELQARHLFPLQQAAAHRELAPALAWALERTSTDADGDIHIPDEVRDRMRELGIAHRRHGFPSTIYAPFAEMCTAALGELNRRTHRPVVKHLIQAAARAFAAYCASMAEAAEAADLAGEPPAQMARVREVNRATSRTSVVRLEAAPGPSFAPGQALMVTASYTPGLWRALTPAAPQNPGGFLEFHVRATEKGTATGLLARAKVGDFWTVGAAHGRTYRPDTEHELVILAFETGLAAAEALVFSLLDAPARPTTHLLVHACYPGDHYDLERLRSLAEHADWLTVHVTVAEAIDPFWLPAPGGRRREASEIGALKESPVALASSLAQHRSGTQVLLTGPVDEVGDAHAALTDYGVNPAAIHTLDFDAANSWPGVSAHHRR